MTHPDLLAETRQTAVLTVELTPVVIGFYPANNPKKPRRDTTAKVTMLMSAAAQNKDTCMFFLPSQHIAVCISRPPTHLIPFSNEF